MGKSLVKDIIREIKKSFGRFIAIFAIVAIGVAFFAGVTAASSDMRHSADAYFDEYNLMDIRLISTIGFNEKDIRKIREVDGINGVFATHTLDALVQLNRTQVAMKVMTVPAGEYDSQNQDYINRLRIKEGRLPEKSGECVLKYENVENNSFKIGDTITLQSGTDVNISETLNTDEFVIVGIVHTPYYLSFEMGITPIGNGTISNCIIIPESDFSSEYYTEVFATVDDAKKFNSYHDEYFDIVDKVTDKLKVIGKSSVEERIADIKNEFNESIANQFLSNSSDWKWYVLDRNSHYSYRDYGQCADRMDSIASVFPIFFIFVAALVCLTTMTRMVDEHRGTIGTFKALGYSKSAIALKYIAYALIASVFGGILGCIIGLNVFPRVIYTSWNIAYQLPDIQFADHTVLILIAIVSMATITTLAAFFACNSELVEQPSLLMRPKTPKKGKKILLERIGFIWKRMKFTQKVTARNIFRYKKRFIMTLIGIAGCTALLMAGFGIKDSISGLVANQFDKIFKYDVTISYSDDISDADYTDLINDIKNDSRFSDVITLNSSTTIANVVETEDADNQDLNINFIAINDNSAINEFITFGSRTSDKKFQLTDDGVIISEKLSKDLKAKVGDRIFIENSEGVRKQVKVSNIMEMYISHYVFITDLYYEEIFGEKVVDNEILGILDLTDHKDEANIDKESLSKLEDDLGNEYQKKSGVQSITFFSGTIGKFDDMIKSLDLVTYVLIVSAALLAFVVLYNLTNVNISERLREIATIKVLGFYDKEVAFYVYRENIIITIIGSLVGLALGVVLHRFIMTTVEMEGAMFGNEIKFTSFLVSFLLTLVFSLIVNVAMYKKLTKIQMVESLKSVE